MKLHNKSEAICCLNLGIDYICFKVYFQGELPNLQRKTEWGSWYLGSEKYETNLDQKGIPYIATGGGRVIFCSFTLFCNIFNAVSEKQNTFRIRE